MCQTNFRGKKGKRFLALSIYKQLSDWQQINNKIIKIGADFIFEVMQFSQPVSIISSQFSSFQKLYSHTVRYYTQYISQ